LWCVTVDDDKWYSSDEEEDSPNKALGQTSQAPPLPGQAPPPASQGSSFNVMQMINAIKSTPTPSTAAAASTTQTPSQRYRIEYWSLVEQQVSVNNSLV